MSDKEVKTPGRLPGMSKTATPRKAKKTRPTKRPAVPAGRPTRTMQAVIMEHRCVVASGTKYGLAEFDVLVADLIAAAV